MAYLAWFAVVLLCPHKGAAGVMWLEIGSAATPAIGFGGAPVTEAEVGNETVLAFSPQGRYLGPVDTRGLDAGGGPGHFLGVVVVPAEDAVHLELSDAGGTALAELGDATVLASDFSPVVDPNAYRTSAPELQWRQREEFTLAVEADGPGSIAPVGGRFLALGTAEVRATAAQFHQFLQWSGDVPPLEAENNPLTLTMDRDRHLQAVFVLQVDDIWLENYFGTTDVVLDADPDNDGLSTRREFAVGTDPTGNAQVTADLTLQPQWNLVSLPVQPSAGRTPADVLAAVGTGTPWSWDSWRQSYECSPSATAGAGYWVFVQGPVTTVSVTGQDVIDQALVLMPGWNLFGPAFDIGLPGDVPVEGVAWCWDATAQVYRRQEPDGWLVRGRTYWLFARSAFMTVVSRPRDRMPMISD